MIKFQVYQKINENMTCEPTVVYANEVLLEDGTLLFYRDDQLFMAFAQGSWLQCVRQFDD